MNKRKIPFVAILLPIFLLPSCSLLSEKVSEQPSYVVNEDNTLTWTHSVDSRKILGSRGIPPIKNSGTLNLLVVPISFANSNGFNSVNRYGYSSAREAIYNNFFGETNKTGWESVSSYYYKSSYGNLNIVGDVSPIVALSNDINYYNAQGSAGAASDRIGELAIEALKQGGYDLSSFDEDKDGVLDAVWFIYNLPYNKNGTDLEWAYTTSNSRSQRKAAYKIKSYAWASYYFMGEGKYTLPDAHTFIHETGHLLGLDDYYNYDTDVPNYPCPMGGLDMMDYNIGDHNAFSKYLFGWISPRQVVSSGTYRLKNFQKTGDALILATNYYNGTPYGEYLIFEYYTPTGLNEKDAKNHYSTSKYPLMYTKEGLRILHVDSRIGYIKTLVSNPSWNGIYLDSVDYYIKNGRSSTILASNTPSQTFGTKTNNLLELVSASTKGDIGLNNNRQIASDNDLFVPLNYNQLNSYKFNDDSVIPYTIKVKGFDLIKGEMIIEFIP